MRPIMCLFLHKNGTPEPLFGHIAWQHADGVADQCNACCIREDNRADPLF